MTLKTIMMFSCNDLKLVPFIIGIEFMLVVILETELTAEWEKNKTKSLKFHIILQINSNNGKFHHKIPSTTLTFSL